jgi:superfamily II DNA or RNA helicase
LTGKQGVIIPAANLKNLMIKLIVEEAYVVSHHVHHLLSEQPGYPYNVNGGFWYCFLADANHQGVNRDLDERGVEYCYLDGRTRDRQKAIESFTEGNQPLFLLSLRAGGTGINLAAADVVIHLDPWWNPAVEEQATDRAHRIGQVRTVSVYRLVAAGTVEEAILRLKQRKRAIAGAVMDEGLGDLPQLTSDEIEDLFRFDA